MSTETTNDVATARSLRWPLLVLAAGILIAVAPFLSGAGKHIALESRPG
jgi:hypothetical protein